jgi:sialidase-1
MSIKEILMVLVIASAYSTTCLGNKTILKTFQYQVPVLINKENNPVLQMQLLSEGADSVRISGIVLSLKGTTDINDIRTVRIFCSGNEKEFVTKMQYGKDREPSLNMLFSDDLAFSDTCNLWVALELKSNASLTHKINILCKYVKSGIDQIKPSCGNSPQKLRIALALRQHMDDNVNTYRIPGLATTKNGTLLANYDVRRESSRDLQGNIDIGLSRSVDGGSSWEPMKIILDMGEWGGLPEKFNGVSDACILVDNKSNNIFIAGLWMHGLLDKNGKWIEGLSDSSTVWNHQWKNKGSQPGFGVKETSQFIITESTDDGITWSTPSNITSEIKKKEWWLIAPAPGHGITLANGIIVFPSEGRDEKGETFSNITWSDNGGGNWHTSEPACNNSTENMAVQLSDGSIMLNMRYNYNKNNLSDSNGRAIYVTNDLGKTWSEHPTSRRNLIEPVCMGSIHKHIYSVNGVQKSLLLFLNPDSKTTRDHMTLKVSFDDGMTWPRDYWILLDEKKSRGYSCITSVNENEIAVLYESSQADLVFEKIPLTDILHN